MIESYTDVKPWSVEDIINALKEDPPKKEKIIVPKFQRTLVWSDKQRKLLIDSIKNGMPIGALLLYKVGEANGITEYQLIDGLQRVTTLRKYYDKPTDFFDEVNLPDNLISDIVKFLNENKDISISKEDIRKWIVEWIRSINGFDEADGFSSYKVAKFLDEKIKDKFEKELNKDELDTFINILQPYLKKIKEESDISNFKIPVIIYTGDQSNLPMIFERINSKGTQLNKYQIFAATWSAYKPIQINNREIIDKIKAKYDALIDEGFEIENYDPINFYTSEFTYFEYLFGLGKLMVDKYPLLFKSTSAEHEADSIGFNIVAICLKHDLKNLSTLPEQLKKVDVDDLEKKIFNAIDVVNNILKPYIGLRANKKNGKEYPIIHSEFQMVSIIGKVFHSIYELKQNENGIFEIQENVKWNDLRKKLEKNIPFHYLYDIIKGFWSGTGDKKAMERADSDKYEKQIAKDIWDVTLNEWHENEKSKKEKNRESVNKVSVLFLKYIYTHLLTANEELSTIEFEVDHVIPFARLKKIATDIGDGLPISAIGNLALIKKDLNRVKKDKTFYEYLDDLSSKGEITEAQKHEEIKRVEKYTFTTRDMLEFIYDLNKNNIDKFYKYLDKRFKKLKDKFYELNNINDGM